MALKDSAWESIESSFSKAGQVCAALGSKQAKDSSALCLQAKA